MRKFLICITGMPGAGKTTVAIHMTRFGLEVVSMGDVIREEVRRRGYPLTRGSQFRVVKEVREESGPAAVAMLSKPRIESSRSSVVIIDGVRSPEEVSFFRELGTVKVLAVHASPRRRYFYLVSRGRSDDPRDWRSFEERDEIELSLRVGDVIALADGMLVNEKLSLEELGEEVERIVGKWVRDLEEKAPSGAGKARG